jgi:hypothetical protein
LFIFAIDFHILKISAKNTATATLPLLREPGEIIALSKEKKGGAIWQFGNLAICGKDIRTQK